MSDLGRYNFSADSYSSSFAKYPQSDEIARDTVGHISVRTPSSLLCSDIGKTPFSLVQNSPNSYKDIASPLNGRINLMKMPSKDVVFQMMEKIEVKNKATDYRDALTGTWEHNPLETAFFSAENIQKIQDTIKSTIYKLSNQRYVLPNQNIDNLKIIMRGLYLQHAQHIMDGIREQVDHLNKLVLDHVIPNLYNESIAYEKYIRDQSTLVMPLPLPLQPNRDYKQLEIKPWT